MTQSLCQHTRTRSSSWFAVIGWSLGLLLSLTNLPAAEQPTIQDNDLPRTPHTPAERAVATFTVRDGYRLDLAAAEPLVASPIAICFDEWNRLYVVEMIDYSERRPEMLGRIRRLEDVDGDGRYDRSTVVARGLPWPTGVFWAGGALYVAATPNIIKCTDTDGDGVMDRYDVVFTGFASDYAPYETNRLNVQAMLNSFNWGLDNRIHGATSFNGGRVTNPSRPGTAPLELRGRDFSFDPRLLDLESEVGGGQYGVGFDDTGRKFFCSNSDHIQVVMFEERYAARHAAYLAPNPRVSIAVDGPAATVYRLSPDEPWRVIRTKWRVSGVVPGLIEGGGRPSGYFTSATGLTLYRGDAWPLEDQGDAFIADCGSNLVHRKKIRSRGVELYAERALDEQKSEFLASTDLWFRPVDFANAPDGCLYMIDMYREIIEHPWSLPQPLKSHLDLNAGNDRGRLYRIAPEGFRQPKLPPPAQATTPELVALLTHPNSWHRETAARLLCERREASALEPLRKLLADVGGQTRPPVRFRRSAAGPLSVAARSAQREAEAAALGRLHALYVLSSLGALEEEQVLAALRDPSPAVRRHAVRLAEPLATRRDALPELANALWQHASDPDAWVRYQLAFSLGSLPHPKTTAALHEILRQDAGDRWMRAAVLTSLSQGAGALLELVMRDEPLAASPSGREFLRGLVEVIGAQNRPAEDEICLRWLATAKETGMELLGSYGAGLARSSRTLEQVDREHRLQPLFASAAHVAGEASRTEAERVSAVRVVGMGPFEAAAAVLPALLDPVQPQAVQLTALAAWARYPIPAVAQEILKRWGGFTPRLRSEALAVLLARPDRTALLLDAVERGDVPRADIPSTEADALRKHKEAGLRERASRLLTALSSRDAVVRKFSDALTLPGVPERGRTNYTARCASCHRSGGEGHAVGPDLETVRTTGREKVLTSILDPNRDVQPNYQAYDLETRDGDSLSGIVIAENASGVTLRRAFGEQTTVPRANISSMKGRGQSLMPEELEAGLTAQDLADLLAFILGESSGR